MEFVDTPKQVEKRTNESYYKVSGNSVEYAEGFVMEVKRLNPNVNISAKWIFRNYKPEQVTIISSIPLEQLTLPEGYFGNALGRILFNEPISEFKTNMNGEFLRFNISENHLIGFVSDLREVNPNVEIRYSFDNEEGIGKINSSVSLEKLKFPTGYHGGIGIDKDGYVGFLKDRIIDYKIDYELDGMDSSKQFIEITQRYFGNVSYEQQNKKSNAEFDNSQEMIDNVSSTKFLLDRINNYVEIFMESVFDKRLVEIQVPILVAIEKTNVVDLISLISELKPRIAYLESELNTRNLELASRNMKISAGDQEFDQMARNRGISRGELLVELGKEINSIQAKKELTYNSVVALKSWLRVINNNVEKKINSMSSEEKQQLYSNLTNAMKQNESSIDLLSHEIAHREFQTDEEIQEVATRRRQTFEEVKNELALEIIERNLKIARLEEQNNIINDYKIPLIQTIEIEVHRSK